MQLNRDLKSKTAICAKGILFGMLCLVAAIGTVLESQRWKEGLLIGIAIWAGARFYYFLFYVLENYVDKNLK